MAQISDNIVVAQDTSIEGVFRCFNANKMGIVFVLDENRRVVGCVTDGDIRRQLLVHNDLSVAVFHFMNRDFAFADVHSPREHVLKLLDHRVRIIPVLDADGRLVRFCSRENFHLQGEAEVFARARAPTRISFGGGGSDLTHYFFEQGGVVINATIAKYAHASLRLRAGTSIRIYSHDLAQTVEVAGFEDLKIDGRLDLIKSVIHLIKPSFGFDLEVGADFPVGSGLGGSASIAVAIIGCFNEFRSDPWRRHQISEMAFQAERLILNIPGGWQDQYAAAFGGFNYMEFSARENDIIPLRLESQILRELEASIVLCHTGKSHESGTIHIDQKRKLTQSANVQAAMQRQKDITAEMKRRLLRGDVHGYGQLLNEGWQLKRGMSDLISNGNLDRIYECAIANGAVGGKLLGAGGGGYFMFFVPPFERYRVSDALEKLGFACERVLFDKDGLVSWKTRIEQSAAGSDGPKQEK